MLYVTEASDVSMGETHTCIVDQGGRARCVGYDFSGYYVLGDGTSQSSNALVNVSSLQSGVAQVFSSTVANCALMTTGAARCWGYNYYGVLGSGNTSTPTQPVQVIGFETSGAVLIAMGEHHTCFLSAQGKILCTGSNENGQLGVGSSVDSNKPNPVLGQATNMVFVSVSCGFQHSCAVSDTGAVLCWGENRADQVGLGSNTVAFTLPQKPIVSGASSVWVNDDNTLVIMSDGTAMVFGENAFGVLGTGNTVTVRTPTPFASGVGNIKELRGGEQATCVLFLDDTIQCLGSNTKGQFGTGSTTPQSSLVLVSRLTGAALAPTVPVTLKPTSMAPTTMTPTQRPTDVPTTLAPTMLPTPSPTRAPTLPTAQPTRRPTRQGGFGEDGGAASSSPTIALAVLSILLLA
ncbi:hypothetical protein BASA81_002632 [Batrachochytrium salamandrivorans]|nr:hypothetical protein BASA81_002632 [Batrachochytrium salamandrivorans]